MKTLINITTIILILAVAAGCSFVGGEKIQTEDAAKVENASFDRILIVKPNESILAWEGYKPTGQHHGTVGLTEGNLMIKDGEVAGGKFVFDMNSIAVLDLTNPEWNGKLTRHLKSPDFFEVENHPQATFEITVVKPIQATSVGMNADKGEIIPTHSITGNLSMKGISRSITFDARIDKSENLVLVESNMFFIDRTEWNVQYKSKKISAKFKDDFINDEMGIKLKIVSVPGENEMASQ